MSGLRTHYQESILDGILSNSPREIYHFNRYGELEIDYSKLEEAFVDEYGKEVGYLLFNDICDEVDIEQLTCNYEQETSESRQLDSLMGDVYSQLATMNRVLYGGNRQASQRAG